MEKSIKIYDIFLEHALVCMTLNSSFKIIGWTKGFTSYSLKESELRSCRRMQYETSPATSDCFEIYFFMSRNAACWRGQTAGIVTKHCRQWIKDKKFCPDVRYENSSICCMRIHVMGTFEQFHFQLFLSPPQ